MNWRLRMDLHHQPPASKAGALRVELRGCIEKEPVAGVAPASSAYKTEASLLMLGRQGQVGRARPNRTAPLRSERSMQLSQPVPDEMDARPGLAPGNPVLRTGGSMALPCAR